MLDDQSEIDVNKHYWWTLNNCSQLALSITSTDSIYFYVGFFVLLHKIAMLNVDLQFHESIVS
jgi:hypothetical protein